MSYLSQQDSDRGRLPEGMERVGYDADTQVYSYRDPDGSYWEGDPGSRYGELRPSGSRRSQITAEADETLRQLNQQSWRYMLPFFLMVSVVLLLLFRYLWSAGPAPLTCPGGSGRYMVKTGDSCWGIADGLGSTVAELERLNLGLRCSSLRAGEQICVPSKT